MSIRTVIDFSPLSETTIPCRILAATASFSATGVPVPAVLSAFAAARSLRRDVSLALALLGPLAQPAPQASACGPPCAAGATAAAGAAPSRADRPPDSGSAAGFLSRSGLSLLSRASGASRLGRALRGWRGGGSSPAACEDEESSSATGPAADAPRPWASRQLRRLFSSRRPSSLQLFLNVDPALLGHRQQLGDVPPGAAQAGRVLQLAGRLPEAQVELPPAWRRSASRSARRL